MGIGRGRRGRFGCGALAIGGLGFRCEAERDCTKAGLGLVEKEGTGKASWPMLPLLGIGLFMVLEPAKEGAGGGGSAAPCVEYVTHISYKSAV